MKKCRICKTSVPNWQTFCLHCGARIYVGSIATKNEGFFERFRVSIKDIFRSEEDKKADKLIENSTSLARYSTEAIIPEHEEATRLSPKYKSILATSYAATGTERMRNIDSKFRPFGVWGKEEHLRQVDALTKPIVSVLKKMIDTSSFYGDLDLNRAFNGALELFEKSIDADPEYASAYFQRAHAFRDMADNILMAYRVYPRHIVDWWIRHPIKNVQETKMDMSLEYDNIQLGFYSKESYSGFKFKKEMVWLYERAEEDYRQALDIDQTYTMCYVDLVDLLGQLGKHKEASDSLNKALSILNKAIQADNTDIKSYIERAEVYDKLDNVKLAIADLEHVLTLETMEYQLKSIRERIETLRKIENKS
jgi:tetratricopeptide (TPR) repeat protein